jgi:hypothetical protein
MQILLKAHKPSVELYRDDKQIILSGGMINVDLEDLPKDVFSPDVLHHLGDIKAGSFVIQYYCQGLWFDLGSNYENAFDEASWAFKTSETGVGSMFSLIYNDEEYNFNLYYLNGERHGFLYTHPSSKHLKFLQKLGLVGQKVEGGYPMLGVDLNLLLDFVQRLYLKNLNIEGLEFSF